VPVLRELDPAAFAGSLRGETLTVTFDGLSVPVPIPRLAAAIVARVDGRRSWGEIAAAVAAGGPSPAAVARDIAALRAALEPMNRLLLAAPAA
jgi:hypothetical protein